MSSLVCNYIHHFTVVLKYYRASLQIVEYPCQFVFLSELSPR